MPVRCDVCLLMLAQAAMMRVLLLVIVTGCSLAALAAGAGSARAEGCADPVASLASVEGRVEVQRAGESRWQPAVANLTVCRGDQIRTASRSRALLSLTNDGVYRIDQGTSVRIVPGSASGILLFDLVQGAIDFFSHRPRTLEVGTPYVNAAVEGTEFLVRVDGGQAEIAVFLGRVVASRDGDSVRLGSGEAVVATAGAPLETRLIVRPRDYVAWAAYYPPLFAVLADRAGVSPAGDPGPAAEALRLAGRSDSEAAFAAFAAIPESDRDARFYLYRGAVLLSVGRADAAGADLDRSLGLDPRLGRAYAVRAMAAIVADDRERALADTEQAVTLEPAAAPAWIARSYALQASGRLAEARAAAQSGVDAAPDDALALARLAELELAMGERRRAVATAERAVAITPGIARTQTVLGFAALAAVDTATAARAFWTAIELDSAAPLPRLGYGLARIRQGDLEQGRRHLELAVGLDPTDALLRAYLGKGYFEERRDPLDAEQFARAQELDPNDPTAFLYDAIRLQTENQPVAALRQIERSIELNDNRAVYRSSLLLDKDRADRGASLARIYNDLGFEQQGEAEAGRSLAFDPASAAAHQFLADIYATQERVRVARVSEQLQAQLLQDVGMNPVRPSLADYDLAIGSRGGPAALGLNEFTPLFDRNGVQFGFDGLAGNLDTYAGEGIVSAVYDQVAVSGGYFHYQTEGFRDNNDNRHDIGDLFVQAAILPELNVQLEYRARESEYGDLAYNFDLTKFFPDDRIKFDEDFFRFGGRWQPTPASNFLVSAIFIDQTEDLEATRQESAVVELAPGFFLPVDFALEGVSRTEANGYQGEFGYIYSSASLNVTTGAGATRIDRQGRDRSTFTVTDQATGFPLFTELASEPFAESNNAENVWIYADLRLPETVTWSLGGSYVDYREEGFLRRREVLPKLGARWRVFEHLELRAAWFKTLNRTRALPRSIEPTQVAGFNQFFDDADGTLSERFGFAADAKLTTTIALNAEYSERFFDLPNRTPSGVRFVDWNERLARATLSWVPFKRLAVNVGVEFELLELDNFRDFPFADFPIDIETWTVPLRVGYFDPSGFYATSTLTAAHQSIEPSVAQSLDRTNNAFFLVDASIGYRLPKRTGSLSFEVNNLFDENFYYQDRQFISSEPQEPRFVPTRTFLGRLTLSF